MRAEVPFGIATVLPSGKITRVSDEVSGAVEGSPAAEPSAVASLKWRRRAADVVWIIGLLIAPGPLLINVTSNWIFLLMGLSIVLIVAGLLTRSRLTRAIWWADPAAAPPEWRRTWLMDFDGPDRPS